MLQSVKVRCFFLTLSWYSTVLLFFILIKIQIFLSQLASVLCLVFVLGLERVDLFFKLYPLLLNIFRETLWQLSWVERIFVCWWFFVFKLIEFLPIVQITKFFFLNITTEPWLVRLLKLSHTRWFFFYWNSRNNCFILCCYVLIYFFYFLINLKQN